MPRYCVVLGFPLRLLLDAGTGSVNARAAGKLLSTATHNQWIARNYGAILMRSRHVGPLYSERLSSQKESLHARSETHVELTHQMIYVAGDADFNEADGWLIWPGMLEEGL